MLEGGRVGTWANVVVVQTASKRAVTAAEVGEYLAFI